MTKLIDQSAVLALAESAGFRHDREMQETIAALYFNPDEKDAQHLARLAADFQLEAKMAGRLNNPFLPSPPLDVLQAGEIPIGTIPGYTDEVRIPIEGHKYIAGRTRSGKTTLVELIILLALRRGIQVLVMDPENQIAPDIGGALPNDQVYEIDAASFHVNPFTPPEGMDIRNWFGEMANVDREAFFYRKGAENFAMTTKLRMLESKEPINLRSFFDAVKRGMPRGARREYESWESVKSTTEALLLGLPTLVAPNSPGLQEMFSRQLVMFNWSSLKNHQLRKYLTLHILSWLLASREYDPDGHPPLLVVCDEISKIASTELQNTSDIAEPFFISAIRTAAKRGISFVTLDQTPSRTHPVVRANSDVQVLMLLDHGQDKTILSSDFDLTPDQRAYFSTIPLRQAIVKLPRIPPFLIDVPEISHGHHSSVLE